MQSASKKGLARAARRGRRDERKAGAAQPDAGHANGGGIGDPTAVAHGGELPYVSRGGLKLAGALECSKLPVRGRRAIDIGASTGGFTDCLLRSGAASVIAVDVGYGQLAWRLRTDERVHVIERQNARLLGPEQIPHSPSLAVIDVSFISLSKVLPALIGCLESEHDILALIKPQFEVGKGRVGKGGVVRDQGLRVEALVSVTMAACALGERFRAFLPAPIAGPKGNLETFVWLSGAGGGSDGAGNGPKGAAGGPEMDCRTSIEREALTVEAERQSGTGAA